MMPDFRSRVPFRRISRRPRFVVTLAVFTVAVIILEVLFGTSERDTSLEDAVPEVTHDPVSTARIVKEICGSAVGDILRDDEVQFFAEGTSRWGNALSPYWQARALAHFSGLPFRGRVALRGSWLHYLPRSVAAAGPPDFDAVRAMCSASACRSWDFPHECHHSWSKLHPVIITETREAIDRWLNATRRTRHMFGPNDVVVTDRCASDTLLWHTRYGPYGWSLFDNIPANAAHIYVVGDPREEFGPCVRLRRALLDRLKRIRPRATVEFSGGKLWEDFFKLVYAPNLFLAWTGSFGLFAGLANSGKVFSGPVNHCVFSDPLEVARRANATLPDPEKFVMPQRCSALQEELEDNFVVTDVGEMLPTGGEWQEVVSVDRTPMSRDMSVENVDRPSDNLHEITDWLVTH